LGQEKVSSVSKRKESDGQPALKEKATASEDAKGRKQRKPGKLFEKCP